MISARLAVLLAALLLPMAAAAQPVPFDFVPAMPGARLTADTYVPTALACSINSACPEGEGADAAVRATVQVVDGGACSGVLLNNTREDRTPYILTAYHCFPAAVGDTVQWDVRFGYQSPTCANPSEAPVYQTVTGGVVRAAQYGFADFVLVELTTPVPEEVYFAGWSIEDTVPQRGLAVGHPRGDLQKLTLDDDPLKTSPFTSAYWIAHYDRGVMEPGSSGAPLFNEALQMIGHVKGAYALMGSCGGPDGDDNYPIIYHPKLSYIWTHGVAPLLDPDGTGRTTMPALPPPPPVWISEINADAHPADPGAGEFVELAGRPGATLDDLVLDVYDCRAGQAELRASEALKAYTFRDEGDQVGHFVLGGTALDRTVRDQRLGRRPKREAGQDGYLPDHQGILVLRHRDGTTHFDYRYGSASATDIGGWASACPDARLLRSPGDFAGDATMGFAPEDRPEAATTGTAALRATPGAPNVVTREAEPRPEMPLSAGAALAVYPNPFNPHARLSVRLDRPQHAEVAVFDVLARRVALLHRGFLDAGTAHTWTFDGSTLPSGIYLLRVTGEGLLAQRTLTLVK